MKEIVAIWLAISLALYLALVYSPNADDRDRMIYFHVPMAWISYLAFTITFVGSTSYLKKRNVKLDDIAHSSAKLGLLFGALALVTGAIWAKMRWGAFWNWDPRQTTTLILWLVYAAYLTLRSAIVNEEKRARITAVFAILGFICIIISYVSVKFSALHPQELPTFGGT
ncbi:MAG: cytochrome c biogenesis protein [Candidatus Hydrothermarchaeota archaeon]